MRHFLKFIIVVEMLGILAEVLFFISLLPQNIIITIGAVVFIILILGWAWSLTMDINDK